MTQNGIDARTSFRNILVPVDLSERSESAIETALGFAAAGDGVVRLLHVVQTMPELESPEDVDFCRELYDKSIARLVEWQKQYERLQGELQCEVIYGDRSAEIMMYAEEKECDLVVMTTHQLDPDEIGKGLGTISHRVALFCRCPVLLLR